MVHTTDDGMKRLPAVFYRTEAGAEPVRVWLKGSEFDDKDRIRIGRDVAKVEFGWPIGMPTCNTLGHGLLEVRTELSGNRITRILFCISDSTMVLLHGFVKKATDGNRTPRQDIDLAHQRRANMKKRKGDD